jgi:hypothetical protein
MISGSFPYERRRPGTGHLPCIAVRSAAKFPDMRIYQQMSALPLLGGPLLGARLHLRR